MHLVQATDSAFAAILADGSVATWGGSLRGGDSHAVQAQRECAAHPSECSRVCSSSLQQNRRDVGLSSLWLSQRCCAESAEECVGDSS